MDTLLCVPQGEFTLKRLPSRKRELLRAWDAADEYLLNYLAEEHVVSSATRLLIVNDSFGALAVALNAFQPYALSDSYLSHAATQMNLVENGLSANSVHLLNSLEQPSGSFDLVLIKVPKTLALLEDELIRIRPCITPTTTIIGAGMIKGMPKSVWVLFERLLGSTQTSLARKKARLIFVNAQAHEITAISPYPVCYQLEDTEITICNHANVFSRDSLDIGTRFFLKHLPQKTSARDIIDLGCGNGVVGLMASLTHPQATISFVDESFMAVASAEENFRRQWNGSRKAYFQADDCLAGFKTGSADLILCNPPFHQQSSVGDQIAMRMFKQSKDVLRQGGELWVIGNRHLDYPVSIKRIFGNCELIASNPKFTILRACRQ